VGSHCWYLAKEVTVEEGTAFLAYPSRHNLWLCEILYTNDHMDTSHGTGSRVPGDGERG